MKLYQIRILLLFAFTLIYSKSFSQTFFGKIVDEYSNALINVHIRDTVNNTQSISNKSGEFNIKTYDNSVLKLSHVGYKTKYLSSSNIDDTTRFFIQLEPETNLLHDVNISAERIKKVINQFSVNVLDYIPYSNYIIALKSYKSQKIISIEGIDTTYREFNLGKIKAKSLYEDCYGNIHILSKDSSYQIWIDSTLHIISSSSILKFNEVLKPCIGNYKEANVFFSFSNHNKQYTLTSINKKSLERNHFFSVLDAEAEKVAREDYNNIIKRYCSGTCGRISVIETKNWNGNLMTLANTSELHIMISWYLKTSGKEINVKSFQVNNKLVAFDFNSDSVHIFNSTGTKIHQTGIMSFPKKTKKEVRIDKMNDKIYILSLKNGVYSLSLLDLTQGSWEQSFKLGEVPFAKNIQVFDDWVYFKMIQNGFYKLYRIKIDLP